MRLLRLTAIASLVGATTLAASAGATWLVPIVVVVAVGFAYAAGILDVRDRLRRELGVR